MMAKTNENVIVIPAKEKVFPIKVAAYYRVSDESDEQNGSFEAQIKYYKQYINENPEWILVGIYAEKATGTDFRKRKEFNRMIKDAKVGKIDIILTKSVTRFGRNTIPFLKNLRELSKSGADVRFDLEDINTIEQKDSSEITLLAAIA